MPVLHKNWEALSGETLNFSVDYRSGNALFLDTLTKVDLTNYTARMVVKKNGSELFQITEPYDIYKDAPEGHLEVTLSSSRVLQLSGSLPIDYIIFLDNKYDALDTYAILRGRIKVVLSA